MQEVEVLREGMWQRGRVTMVMNDKVLVRFHSAPLEELRAGAGASGKGGEVQGGLSAVKGSQGGAGGGEQQWIQRSWSHMRRVPEGGAESARERGVVWMWWRRGVGVVEVWGACRNACIAAVLTAAIAPVCLLACAPALPACAAAAAAAAARQGEGRVPLSCRSNVVVGVMSCRSNVVVGVMSCRSER